MQLSMFLSEEPLASPSALQDSERDWMIRVATSCSPILTLLTDIAPVGWSGKTSPVSFQATEDGILPPSFSGWANSGMGSPTECLTLNISDWPKDASVSSLWQVLEDGSLPPQYFLSARACQGILRRAEKRGRELPAPLRSALMSAQPSELEEIEQAATDRQAQT